MTKPDPAELDIRPARASFWRNLSFIWFVPVLALAVSLGLAWQSYSQRGVAIAITFSSAPGVTPGETTIRYRDVVVGTVEDVTFTEDLSRVLVLARVNKDVAPFLDAESEFWIVSPKVSTRGISGLSTVLSGVYIEGAWDQEPGVQQWSFVGGDGPPLVQPGREGKRISLITTDGSLISEGAPVFFHGVEVGRLEKPRLTVSSDAIIVDAFIEAPHDRRLNAATRFWDTSGFSVSLGGQGLTLDFDSIASVVAGGIEFDTIYEGGTPVSAGHVFTIYPDEAEARRRLFVRSSGETVSIAAEFDEIGQRPRTRCAGAIWRPESGRGDGAFGSVEEEDSGRASGSSPISPLNPTGWACRRARARRRCWIFSTRRWPRGSGPAWRQRTSSARRS